MPETTVRAEKTEGAKEALVVATVTGFLNIVAILVERFGWPGFLLCGGMFFVVEYATLEQKHKLIELYLLGQGTPYVACAVSALFVLVLMAQHSLYKRKLRVLEQRIGVLEREKDRVVTQLLEANARLTILDAKKSVRR